MSEVSLKEHVELAIREQDRRIEQAYLYAQEARNKAEVAIENRLDLLNHYKAQDAERAMRFASKETVDALSDRIKKLEDAINRAHGGILIVALLGVANLVKLFWST